MLQYNPTVSGSLNITGSLQVSGDITGTVNGINITGLSQSVSTQLINVQVSTGSSDAKFETLSGVTSSALTRLTNIESKSASVDISISNINSITSSFSPRVSNLESKSSSVDISISNINSVTASNIARLSNLETKSSSVDISISSINTFTSSNDTKFTTLGTYTGSLDTKNTTLADVTSSLISKTGSYATTGSNQFYGTQVFSGSVYIANDLIVQGSSSIQYISASSVSIGTNIVQLNTANPSVRFAGLTIIDSGSIGGSGSFLYDSVQDEFIFVHRGNGTNVTSSHFVLGPETYDSLGNETYLTTNILTKGTGKEHLIDSCIFDNGTTTCIKNNLKVTGTACFASEPVRLFNDVLPLLDVNVFILLTDISTLADFVSKLVKRARLDAVTELMFVIEMSTLLLFVSKLLKRAMLDAVTELMLEILMSTLLLLLSKFDVLDKTDEVTELMLEIEMSTLLLLLSKLFNLPILEPEVVCKVVSWDEIDWLIVLKDDVNTNAVESKPSNNNAFDAVPANCTSPNVIVLALEKSTADPENDIAPADDADICATIFPFMSLNLYCPAICYFFINIFIMLSQWVHYCHAKWTGLKC